MNHIHWPQFHYLATSLKLNIIIEHPFSIPFRTQLSLVAFILYAFEDLVLRSAAMPAARSSHLRIGEQTQLIKLTLINKVPSIWEPRDYFICTLQLTQVQWVLSAGTKVWMPSLSGVFLWKHWCCGEQRVRGTQ